MPATSPADEPSEILKIAWEEARRALRFGFLSLQVEDAAQEGAVAVLAERKRQGRRLDGALVRHIARRRVITAQQREAVRRHAKTGRFQTGQFRVFYETDGFLAFDRPENEDGPAEPLLAFSPESLWVDGIAAAQLRTARDRALTKQASFGNAPRGTQSKQARSARMKRDVLWARENARPFDSYGD